MKFKDLITLSKTNLWVTSDTHYHHANICRATTNWNIDGLDPDHAGVRDFNSLDEMNQAIVDGINNNVCQDDILLHLGDWAFGGIDKIYKFRNRINCKNVALVLGNHDKYIRRKINSPDIQSLFCFVGDYLQLNIQETKRSKSDLFVFSHFSQRVWDKMHRGSYHLFGHSHGSLNKDINLGKSMDVGIDPAFKKFGEYRPFHISESISILKNKGTQKIDHHEKRE